ncbi:MAG: hypothetical protein AMXMBFR23_11360 [Chloroflexota bacterium]
MASREPTPLDEYLASLPEERRKAVRAVRAAIRKRLPKGYVEQFSGGYIEWVVPLDRYPKTYNRRPLQLAALASQKQYLSVYLNNVYADPALEAWFTEAYAASGKRLDMGKSCVRFKHLDDLPVEVVAEAVSRTPVDEFIAMYERARARSAKA